MSSQACPICQTPYLFSTRVQALVPVCSCLQEKATVEAQEDRYREYLAGVEQWVTALKLGPLKEHERLPVREDISWQRGLVVQGTVGAGKTSLLKQVAYNAALQGYRIRGGYVVELLSRLKDPEQIKSLMAWLESGTLLVLDDIDKALGTQYEVERLLFLIDRYWVHGWPVLASMNMTPDALEAKLARVRGVDLKNESEAILSRLMAKAQVIALNGNDLRRAQ